MAVIRFLSRARWVLVAALVVTLLAACSDSTNPNDPNGPSLQPLGVGNGLPSGAHYNLNIIGVPKDKTASMDNGNGHVIFVPLTRSTKIYLQEGDFAVIDANGTDHDGATFQLPNPDANNDGTTTYSVYARALGKPGGSATIYTCATDPADGTLYCATTNEFTVTRTKNKPHAYNVSKQLLYVYTDLGTGNYKYYPLFSPELQDYYWQYDNDGLKLLQLRFYQVPTTVY